MSLRLQNAKHVETSRLPHDSLSAPEEAPLSLLPLRPLAGAAAVSVDARGLYVSPELAPTCLMGISHESDEKVEEDARRGLFDSRSPKAATAAIKSLPDVPPAPPAEDALALPGDGGKMPRRSLEGGGLEWCFGRREREDLAGGELPVLSAPSDGFARTEMAQTTAMGVRSSMLDLTRPGGELGSAGRCSRGLETSRQRSSARVGQRANL
mmetsp:Transcript_38025/g.74303  ORF Transcript_38025/g.74303 Transcript_38025/m.74303 type:complete len:210 (+) Transcript_38025:893-1522(+)